MARRLRRYAFGVVVEIFFETVCFFIGEIFVYAVSFGRWKTCLQRGNQTPLRLDITACIGLLIIVGTRAVILYVKLAPP